MGGTMNHDIISTTGTGFTFIEKAYIPNVSNFLVIANELKDLVHIHFGKPVPIFTFVNELHPDPPMTDLESKTIYIHCIDTSWAQIAYQLSHELCHLMIGKPVTPGMRWFEESIAEVASRFFMLRLAQKWKTEGILGSPNYADSIIKYVKNLSAYTPVHPIQLSEISNPDSEIWKYLSHEAEDRQKNNQIANTLHPIFEKYPDLWRIVPLLGDLTEKHSLSDFFREWRSLSGESHQKSLSYIFQAFNILDKTD